jgi:hypothetical protein
MGYATTCRWQGISLHRRMPARGMPRHGRHGRIHGTHPGTGAHGAAQAAQVRIARARNPGFSPAVADQGFGRP